MACDITVYVRQDVVLTCGMQCPEALHDIVADASLAEKVKRGLSGKPLGSPLHFQAVDEKFALLAHQPASSG